MADVQLQGSIEPICVDEALDCWDDPGDQGKRSRDMKTPEPMLGWRCWQFARERPASGGLRLGSIGTGALPVTDTYWNVTDTYWNVGVNVAVCKALPCDCDGCRAIIPPHEAPGRSCGCGFWALWEHPWRAARFTIWSDYIIGLVEGSGVVAIHGDEGFRAQKARVLLLLTDYPNDGAEKAMREHLYVGWIADLAGHYGVPALSLKDAITSGLLAELGLDRKRIVGLRQIRPRVHAPAQSEKKLKEED